MFGSKKFTKAKSKSFANEKERKRYFAIQDYYKKKEKETSTKVRRAPKK